MARCPVCGEHVPPEVELSYEEERYIGRFETEMKLDIWYCNLGKRCNAVAAANRLDEMGRAFYAIVGER